jgi:hypothetical protein
MPFDQSTPRHPSTMMKKIGSSLFSVDSGGKKEA